MIQMHNLTLGYTERRHSSDHLTHVFICLPVGIVQNLCGIKFSRILRQNFSLRENIIMNILLLHISALIVDFSLIPA